MCEDGTSVMVARFRFVNSLCSFHLDILTVDCMWRQSFCPTDLLFKQRQRIVMCGSESQCLKWNTDSVNQQLDPTVSIVRSHWTLCHNCSVLICVLSLVPTATPWASVPKRISGKKAVCSFFFRWETCLAAAVVCSRGPIECCPFKWAGFYRSKYFLIISMFFLALAMCSYKYIISYSFFGTLASPIDIYWKYGMYVWCHFYLVKLVKVINVKTSKWLHNYRDV